MRKIRHDASSQDIRGDLAENRPPITRRRFVREGLGAVALAAAGPGVLFAGVDEKPLEKLGEIPRAVLGKTGAKVSILGLGTACLGHKNNNNPDLAEVVPVFAEALERGINYLDTARIYGRAEEALGEVLKGKRDKVFLVSKVWADTAEEVAKSFDETLRKLGVEHVDLLHLHSCGSRKIDTVLAKDGAWGAMQKLKQAGKARFVGLTGHCVPANFVRIIETTKEVDALMVAMNPVDYHVYGFEEKVLPLARKLGIGVMAMKVFGGIQGGFPNYSARKPFPAQMRSEWHFDAVRYAKGLEGVSGMVIGVHSAEQLRQNIKMVLEARAMSAEELAAFRAKGKDLAATWGPRFGPAA